LAARRSILAGTLFVLGIALTACSSTPANDFEAGECTNDNLSGAVGEIDTVDCAEEHTAEAYAAFDVEGDDFPGVEEIQAEAAEGCQGDRFEDYVGVAYADSIFLTTALTPSEETWDADDRTIICIINGTTDGSALDGSAEGAEV
jgi:hypothetical protein